ncbi:hypothetical protein FQA47_011931 [Oryzias melastigma]|uniref:Rapunzel 2 n=1 Tax=Oryzias melastigma TaxID=30732 RepID=A0A834C812_ORYME|nr:protein rapunzel [Oryzias melastigma]KAF6727003.1 hypothetical protein FQA47_011931 [Oryzias melastigma]
MAPGKLKKIATIGLKVLKVSVDIASKFFPPVGVASSVIGMVLDVVEKKNSMEDLQKGFDLIDKGFHEVSKQNRRIMEDIGKATTDSQFADTWYCLNRQFEKYKEMINAPPEEVEKRSQEFVEFYENVKGRQHLYTLYESVIGVSKVFSQPILQVYQQHSGTDRETMINLSQELFSLFSIGCITMMAHGVIIGDDVEGRAKEWEEKMVEVTSAIEKAVGEFK